MESTLLHKYKADEIDNRQDVDRVFGIRKPSFKLSEPVTIVYKDDNLQAKVKKVLRHIVWILEEAQKPVDASQSGVKRVKSLSNLTGKSN
ncbi:hypothetical protein C1645_775247 [Glomus cerebriforme]|uniref:Uncharacterized protein n=1 Tax=Glomus cerebriforme TaxID=658196 RepID=A0A397SQK6_9GLOM|nr:hypothetical protein C1645_775247 [Glomus cerebriforme]